ncbi:MAG: hypothetical protein IKU52_08370 [Clostridia bacterium]|nr:hypothetical protein [Clostridia bacterium]
MKGIKRIISVILSLCTLLSVFAISGVSSFSNETDEEIDHKLVNYKKEIQKNHQGTSSGCIRYIRR